ENLGQVAPVNQMADHVGGSRGGGFTGTAVIPYQAAQDQAARDQAARDQTQLALTAQWVGDQAAQEQAARDQAAREEAWQREQQQREMQEREAILRRRQRAADIAAAAAYTRHNPTQDRNRVIEVENYHRNGSSTRRVIRVHRQGPVCVVM